MVSSTTKPNSVLNTPTPGIACVLSFMLVTKKRLSTGYATSLAPVTLLDVPHYVPTLADLLSESAQKALSAASRSFRERFIAQVPLDLVAETSWLPEECLTEWGNDQSHL
ncbi:hypothetical protein ABBQ32_005988 [Trebouxia sp. C0010 RCD-2024]